MYKWVVEMVTLPENRKIEAQTLPSVTFVLCSSALLVPHVMLESHPFLIVRHP